MLQGTLRHRMVRHSSTLQTLSTKLVVPSSQVTNIVSSQSNNAASSRAVKSVFSQRGRIAFGQSRPASRPEHAAVAAPSILLGTVTQEFNPVLRQMENGLHVQLVDIGSAHSIITGENLNQHLRIPTDLPARGRVNGPLFTRRPVNRNKNSRVEPIQGHNVHDSPAHSYEDMDFSSVLKKRGKKMRKHKLKKRRRKNKYKVKKPI